ncbi:NUDIX domain-containing protein [Nostoc sp. JL31]|uniref:NUDIX domain-containing protein n=1 Tax=Nostoc sp. JL31 TaxID=2815395 RepID=UPI0025CB8CAB|nr:NUDIX domain-containing protein [Nostoc sp. JL31]
MSRRSAHKSIFPLCLDVSMGGYVETGETYEDALQRELKEEFNFMKSNQIVAQSTIKIILLKVFGYRLMI